MKQKQITEFCDAVIQENTKVTAKILKKKQINPNATIGQMSILSYAVLNRNHTAAQQLTCHPMINLNQRSVDKSKFAALHYAVSWLPEIVGDMLSKFADPNIQDGKGNTPLHHAAKQSFQFSDTMPALRALLADHRTDVLAKNEKGETAYDIASDAVKSVLAQHPYVQKFLIEKTAQHRDAFNPAAKIGTTKVVGKAPRIMMAPKR